MANSENRLNFPRLQRVRLRSFSLFSSLPEIEINISDGVFCLVGANGLGKSSFLAAVNYGLTGVVPNFNNKFVSVDEYYHDSMDFCEDYFSGRIMEVDREAAEIEIDFNIGNIFYNLVRGMFEPEELRNLNIYDTELKKEIFISEKSKINAQEINNEYIKHVLEVTGLESFAQLVFLQHFIFTFDERRHLLFWDQKVLEQALHFAFGINPATAKEADSLRREMERAASLARNAHWEANEIRKKISELQKTALDTSESLEGSKQRIFEKYQKLFDQCSAGERKAERLEAQINDENIKLYDLNSRISSLKFEYDEEFNKRLHEQFHVKNHPLIVSSLAEEKCALCGTIGKSINKHINKRISEGKCPLCDNTILEGKVDVKIIQKLQNIDENIIKSRDELENVMKTISRLKSELIIAKKNNSENNSELNKFELQNKALLSKMRLPTDQPDALEKILESYRLQMEELMNKKKNNYEKRDQKKKELQKIQDVLEKRYYAAELEFVPIFKKLAFMFLGIDLGIKLETSGGGLNLILDVKNTVRRQFHQLSESQRYFIDIALRMAFAQYISSLPSKASLFIDTPEGSLDVAYESRAGQMFALFVNNGFDIFMTANINSSRMIRSLAEKCGRKKMFICRMTEWTELSEVQIEEESLFEEVYKEIEHSLDSGKS